MAEKPLLKTLKWLDITGPHNCLSQTLLLLRPNESITHCSLIQPLYKLNILLFFFRLSDLWITKLSLAVIRLEMRVQRGSSPSCAGAGKWQAGRIIALTIGLKPPKRHDVRGGSPARGVRSTASWKRRMIYSRRLELPGSSACEHLSRRRWYLVESCPQWRLALINVGAGGLLNATQSRLPALSGQQGVGEGEGSWGGWGWCRGGWVSVTLWRPWLFNKSGILHQLPPTLTSALWLAS